jgi:hypothetical protein
LVTLCCLVVLFSVVLHGVSPSFLIKPPREIESSGGGQPADLERGQIAAAVKEVEAGQSCSRAKSECDGDTPPVQAPSHAEYISIAEIRALESHPGQLVIVDARKERTYDDSDESIPSSVRVSPEQSVRTATQLGIPKGAVLAVLCA